MAQTNISLEAVIGGLERCSSETECGKECPYWYDDGACRTHLEADALALLKALLKAQEPLKPVADTSYGARPWWFLCGNCKLSVNEDQKYCPNCGRPVKWE